MSDGISALISHWSHFDVNTNDCVHQSDREAISRVKTVRDQQTTVEAFLREHATESSRFHISLRPVPYVGDLRKADIFLLMLNPSLGYADYGTDHKPKFRAELSKTLKQQLTNEKYPCFALNPALWWSSWFVYYEGLFRKTIWEHAKNGAREHRKPYGEALRDLSSRLAILELVPYYSADASQISSAFLAESKSAKVPQAAAKDIIRRAEEKTATVIVRWRKNVARWALDDSEAIVRLESRRGFREARESIVKRLRSAPSSHVE